MADLDEQLRSYSEWLAAEAERAAEHRGDVAIGIEPIETSRAGGRRWWPLVAVAAAVVIIVFAIAAVGAPDAEAPAIRPTQPTAPAPTSVPVVDDTPATVSTSAPATSTPTLLPSGFEDAPMTAGAAPGAFPQPWRDGFIFFETDYGQPILELTDDMAVVLPLDGVQRQRYYYDSPYAEPITLNDVVLWHVDRGQLDQLRADVADHPEVVAAIDAVVPSVEAHFTVDGEQWRTIDLDPPTGPYSNLAVSDDRVVASRSFHGDLGLDQVMIAWSADLVEWDSMVVDLDDSEALTEPQNILSLLDYQLAVTGDRFVLGAEVAAFVDFAPVVPDVVLEAAKVESNWEWSDTGNGIVFTVTTYDEVEGEGEQRFEYTYAELGVPSDPTFPEGESRVTAVAGRLGDSSTVRIVEPPNGIWAFAAHGTFYQGGEQLWESTDGTIWEPIPGVPDGAYYPALELPGGTLFRGLAADLGLDQEPPPMLFRDLSGQIMTVTPPEMPHPYSLLDDNGELTFLTELRPDPPTDDRPDIWLIATLNGDDWVTLDVSDDVLTGTLYSAINGDRVLYQRHDGWEITRIAAG